MKRLVAGGLLGLVVAGLAVLVLVPLPGGPLDEADSGFGGPVQAGHPFTANYELYNNGGRSIEVRSVSLGAHSAGLRLLGARVQTSGTHYGGAWPGFPLSRTTNVPATAFVLRPHGEAPLQIGLLATRTGNYVLRGVKVEYRVRYIGHFGPRYRRTLTTTMSVCAQTRPTKARTKMCRAPQIPE